MAKKKELEALNSLLEEIETLAAWLEDTAYPKRSKQSLDDAVGTVKTTFRVDR